MSAPEEDLAAVAASLAETAERLAAVLASSEHMAQLLVIVRGEGYEEGLDERDAHLATARGQQARAGFQVLPGGRGARKGSRR